MATGLAENLEKRFDNFECPVCMEELVDPRVLSCLHTYCKRCLERLVKHEGEKYGIKCPECRKDTEIPDGQAEKLQVNFILNNLMAEVALHKKSHNGSAAVGCGNCSAGDPTVVRCVSCCIFLCDFCKQGHQRGNATKDHKLLTFEELRSRGPAALSKPSMCHIHEGEARRLYCETCEQTICRDCTIVDHRDHKYQFVKDVYNKEEAAVNQLLGETKAKQSELEEALKGVVEMKTRVQRAGERVAQQINTSVDTLMKALDSRRKNLLQQAVEIEQEKVKVLQVQQEELELALSTVSSSVEFTEKALRGGSQVEVLGMKKQMADRLRELTTETQSSSPCVDDVICYEVKTESLEEVLKGVGRVSDARTDPSKCVMKTGIRKEKMKIRKETKILIIAKDQNDRQREGGDDDVAVEIKSMTSRDGTERFVVIDNGDGTYRTSYIPQVPGVHRVFVKINGAHIQGSPFDWDVKGGSCPEKSTLRMEAQEDGVIYTTLVNQSRDFTIVTRDNNGEQIREEGDEVTVQIKGPNTRTLEVVPVKDRGNGQYTFSFNPCSAGNYKVTVKVKGDNIQGSPFTWGVEQWHLVSRDRGSKYLGFSRECTTVGRVSGVVYGDVVGSFGFSAGCHSWKVKVVRGSMLDVGVTDCDVSPGKQINTWYWSEGRKTHIRNGVYTDIGEPSNINKVTAGDVCIVFLNHHKKQLMVHLPSSGQTDTWGDVTGRNNTLYPYMYLIHDCEITLLQ